MRSDGSPISVAFADPVLRAAGLENDSYGEAKRFFELTDRQLHKIICYCHFGATVNAATAAHSSGLCLPGTSQVFSLGCARRSSDKAGDVLQVHR
jgi:hypothetical protein